MRLLFLIFLVNFIHAQTTLLNEQFNDFRNRNLDAKTDYYFILNAAGTITDEIGGTLTFKAQNSPTLGESSIIYSSDSAVELNGTSQYWQVNPQAPSDEVYGSKLVFKSDIVISNSSTGQYLIDYGDLPYLFSGPASGTIANEILTVSDQQGDKNYYAHATNTIAATWHIVICQWDGTKWQIWLDGTELTMSTYLTPALFNLSVDLTLGAREAGGSYFDGDMAELKLYGSQLTDVDVNNEFYCPAGWTGNGKLTRAADWEFSAGLANDGQIAYPVGAKASGVFQITYQDSVAGGSWTSRDTSITMSTVSTDSLYFLESANALVAKIGLTTFQSNDLGASTVYVDNVVLTYTATDDIQDKGFKEHSRTTRKTRKTR